MCVFFSFFLFLALSFFTFFLSSLLFFCRHQTLFQETINQHGVPTSRRSNVICAPQMHCTYFSVHSTCQRSTRNAATWVTVPLLNPPLSSLLLSLLLHRKHICNFELRPPIRVRRARLTSCGDLIRMCHCHCQCPAVDFFAITVLSQKK